MRLGLIIQNYRAENGLSMDEFARRSGISKSYIGFLEKGIHPKTGKIIRPSIEIIRKTADAMLMDFDTLFNMLDEDVTVNSAEGRMYYTENQVTAVRIPVLGRVAAGQPIDAIEDITGYVLIPESYISHGDFFGLAIKGDSMEPYIYENDIVVVHHTPEAKSGDIIIASVNDNEAICKKYIKKSSKTYLHSLNSSYKDIDVTDDPSFQIIGVVIRLERELKTF